MVTFFVRRVIHGALVVFAVSVVVFLLARLTGDPAAIMLPPDATQEDIDLYRQNAGLNDPLLLQFLRFIGGAVTGDFGQSLMQGTDAMSLVLDRLGPSVQLAAASLVVSLAVGIPVGVLTAVRRGSWVDQVGRAFALVAQCVPNFFLGLMLILFVAVKLRLLPATGSTDLRGLVLPAVTLGLYGAAETVRLLRSSLLEQMNKDYVRTARAKGAFELSVLSRHVFRNAAIPVVTVWGLQFSSLMGRAVVTETVFAYPGMGMLAYQAISNRDFVVIQAFVIVTATIVVAANLLVDTLYFGLDPRIRPQTLRAAT
ncbi:MAG: ABC transporter permease subunit [Streptosporangiales bacterium]|nr:ABC transporter permease subunit [Streptosporangiales bacterium]